MHIAESTILRIANKSLTWLELAAELASYQFRAMQRRYEIQIRGEVQASEDLVMVRRNFAWSVLALAAVGAVPTSLHAQEQSDKTSVWIDLGFPVRERPDGSRFKPMFAPLITDLDAAIREFESAPRAIWIPRAFFGEAVDKARPVRPSAIERITIEGGEVEIIGDAVKIRGAKVEILRNP